jgi:hypothetical protein
MRKYFYVPFIAAALMLSCTMQTGDPESATITVRVPAISRSLVQELDNVSQLTTVYEVFLGQAPTDGLLQRSGPVEPGKVVTFTILPHREYSVFALAGVPDTDGYSYLGGGVYPEIVSMGAGEHRDITITMSPLRWNVTMDYTDADGYPDVRFDFDVSFGAVSGEPWDDFSLETDPADLPIHGPWAVPSGTDWTDNGEGHFIMTANVETSSPIRVVPSLIPFWFSYGTSLPGVEIPDDWHIGYRGGNQTLYDAFNPHTPENVFSGGSLAVAISWE